jgi:hypothetical protein
VVLTETDLRSWFLLRSLQATLKFPFKMVCLCLKRNKVAPLLQRVELPDILSPGGASFPAVAAGMHGDSAMTNGGVVQGNAAAVTGAPVPDTDVNFAGLSASGSTIPPTSAKGSCCNDVGDTSTMDDYCEVEFRGKYDEQDIAAAKSKRNSDEVVMSFAKVILFFCASDIFHLLQR